MPTRLKILLTFAFALVLSVPLHAQTDDSVGDAASFGKEAKFFGYATTGTIMVRENCSVAPFPGPDDRCFQINATTQATQFDVRDIGRIEFPMKTFNNVIYLLSRHIYSYSLSNPAAPIRVANYQYRPYLTIESSALADPSLINPQTGVPFDGKLDIGVAGGRSFAKTLLPGFQEVDQFTYSSTSTSGFTKKYFMDNFNLPQAAVDDLFYQKMTIRLNINGSTANVNQAGFSFAIRFIGN